MTSYVFLISLECPHCRGGVPINGFAEEVLCSGCLKSVPIPSSWWKSHLDEETIREALRCKPGEAKTASYLSGMGEKIAAGNRPARCQSCKTDFADEFLQQSAGRGGGECPNCKQYVRVRKATPLVLSLIEEAELLVNEDDMGGNLGKDATHTVTPVVFGCMSCGGALKVDGSNRTPTCEHCGNPNYLPDALWLRLHPAAVSHPFFVTRKKDAALPPLTLENFPDQMDAKTALQVLKKQNLGEQILVKMHGLFKDNEEVLKAIAMEPNAGEKLLSEIAGQSSLDIRKAMVKRTHLPPKVLSILARDSSPEVTEALLKRSGVLGQPQELIEPLLKGKGIQDLSPLLGEGSFPEWKLFELAGNAGPAEAEMLLKSQNVSERVLKLLGKNAANRNAVKSHPLFKKKGLLARLFFFGSN